MNPIEAGTEAPDFVLMDNKDQNIRLKDYRGKKVLLSWHPLAWTPICTDQMRSLENNWDTLQGLNTVPFGMSVDPAATKKVWAEALRLENLRLPADFWPHGMVAKFYGIFDDKEGTSQRANIIIDENGRVKWIKVYPYSQLPDIQEVIKVLM